VAAIGWAGWRTYVEYRQVTGAATRLMDRLRVDDYAGAYERLCPGHGEETVEGLREEFGRHAKPWHYEVGDVAYDPGHDGYVNLTVTTADRHTQGYAVEVSYVDGRWRACGVSRGSTRDAY